MAGNADCDIHYVECTDDVIAMLATVEEWMDGNRVIALDTETGSVHDLHLRGRGFCRLFQVGTTDEAFVVPAQDFHHGVREVLLMLHNYPVVLANWKYDYHVFRHEGWSCPTRPDDVLMMHRMQYPERLYHNLKYVSKLELGPWATGGDYLLKQEMKENGWTWETIPQDNKWYVYYAGMDVCITAQVWRKMVNTHGIPVCYRNEMAYSVSAFQMEKKGMKVDLAKLNSLNTTWSVELESLASKLHLDYGIEKPLSGKAVEDAFRALGFAEWEYSDAGNVVMDKAALKRIKASYRSQESELAELLLRYRRLHKWRAVYVRKMMESATADERVHPDIKTLEARTGRSSVVNPPLQTIPKDRDTRGVFVADEGYELWAVDYTSQEAKILADVSREPKLIELFTEGDGDIHALIARELDIERDTAKTVVYAKLFGAGDETLGNAVGGGKEQGQAINAMMRAKFPALEEWMKAIVQAGKDNGDDGIRMPNGSRVVSPFEDEEYKYINYSIQGRGAIILKEAVVRLDMAGYAENILMVVHDEILFQFPEGEGEAEMANIIQLMTKTLDSGLTLDVEASGPYKNWGEKYE